MYDFVELYFTFAVRHFQRGARHRPASRRGSDLVTVRTGGRATRRSRDACTVVPASVGFDVASMSRRSSDDAAQPVLSSASGRAAAAGALAGRSARARVREARARSAPPLTAAPAVRRSAHRPCRARGAVAAPPSHGAAGESARRRERELLLDELLEAMGAMLRMSEAFGPLLTAQIKNDTANVVRTSVRFVHPATTVIHGRHPCAITGSVTTSGESAQGHRRRGYAAAHAARPA